MNRSALPIAYAYWRNKSQFLLNRDIYENWTLFAVEKGKFHYELELGEREREGEAEFGDIVICPPGTVFNRRTVTPLTFHFVQFAWEEEPSAAEQERLTGKLSVIDRSRLLSTYSYMRQIGEQRHRKPEAEACLRHMLSDLWWLMEKERGEELSSNWSHTDPLMEKAQQWLLEHAYAPFSMKVLSERLALSPVQLTRRFHAAYLMNPSEFVCALRVDRVCRLLAETSLSLDMIAQQCGYENDFYLSRVFRGKKGMNPSQFRKLHQV